MNYRVIAHGKNAEVVYRGPNRISFGQAHAEVLKIQATRKGLQDIHVVRGGKVVWETAGTRANPQVKGKCRGCGHTKPLFHNREAGKMCRSCLVAVERYGRAHMADAFEDEDTGRSVPFPVKPVTDKRRNPIDRVAELHEKVRSIRDEMESVLGFNYVVEDLDVAERALRRGTKADLDEASWRVLNAVDSIKRAGVGGFPSAIDRPFARLHRLAKRFVIIGERGIPRRRKNPSRRKA